MDEKVQTELVAWIKAGGEFVEAQAPLYAAEVVNWHFYSSVFVVICCVVLCVVSLAVSGLALMGCDSKRIDFFGPVCIISLVVSAFSLLPIGFGAADAIKAKVAPRVVIVEHLAKLTPKK